MFPSSQPQPVLIVPDEGIEDNDLLAAIAMRDEKAFAFLLRRYLPKMVLLARRITLNAEEANDIAQEAFLRVWNNAAKWDPTGTAQFETWLHRVVVNLAISHKRSRRHNVTLDAIAERADDHPSAFDTIHETDKRAVMQNALAHLPPRQRAAVAAFYYQDMSHAQAASRMGLALKAFDGLLVRARRNLKKILGETGMEKGMDIL